MPNISAQFSLLTLHLEVSWVYMVAVKWNVGPFDIEQGKPIRPFSLIKWSVLHRENGG
jgi:hypothetical protein